MTQEHKPAVRTITSPGTPDSHALIGRAQQLLPAWCPGLPPSQVEAFPTSLRDPRTIGLVTQLLVGDGGSGEPPPMALLHTAQNLRLSYLEWLPIPHDLEVRRRLYLHARGEALAAGVTALFSDAWPDEAVPASGPVVGEADVSWLDWLEECGARPVVGTEYEATVAVHGPPGPPLLVCDQLGRVAAPEREPARALVRLILGRKLPPTRSEAIEGVIASMSDDPIRLRPPTHVQSRRSMGAAAGHAALDSLRFRESVDPSDVEAVRRLVAATQFFHADEVATAAELVEERVTKGLSSDYYFVFAIDQSDIMLGYSCYGPIPGAPGRFDLYWLAVHPEAQGIGLGRELVRRTELAVLAAGGRLIYVETAGRPLYAPTRAFYERVGYRQVAELPDFYADGDAKIIYVKAPEEG